MSAKPRQQQPAAIRVTHWLTAILLPIMALSGLQILVAYPAFGPQGAQYEWFPFTGFVPPEWIRIGGWLAGGRAIHFAFMWPLILTGLAYFVYLSASGEWRRRIFLPRRDARHAWGTALAYLRIRPHPEPIGLYNGLQRLAYTGSNLLGIVVVCSGLAMYKPVQLRWLAIVFGGYDPARTIHFLSLVAFGLFVVGHVAMVLAHPGTLNTMISGGRRE